MADLTSSMVADMDEALGTDETLLDPRNPVSTPIVLETVNITINTSGGGIKEDS